MLGGYVIEGADDNTRIKDFLGLLKQHQIDAFSLTKSLKANGNNYTTNSYFVPLAQPQYRLIKAFITG